jgi:hypothetical protein
MEYHSTSQRLGIIEQGPERVILKAENQKTSQDISTYQLRKLQQREYY